MIAIYLSNLEILIGDLLDSANEICCDIKLRLFYIAGYIASKHIELSTPEDEYDPECEGTEFVHTLDHLPWKDIV